MEFMSQRNISSTILVQFYLQWEGLSVCLLAGLAMVLLARFGCTGRKRNNVLNPMQISIEKASCRLNISTDRTLINVN